MTDLNAYAEDIRTLTEKVRTLETQVSFAENRAKMAREDLHQFIDILTEMFEKEIISPSDLDTTMIRNLHTLGIDRDILPTTTYMVTRSYTVEITMEVDAFDEDDAEEMVDDGFDDGDICDAVRDLVSNETGDGVTAVSIEVIQEDSTIEEA